MRRRRAYRAVRAANRYLSRPTRQHVVHACVFAGICTAAALDHFLGMKDIALWVSLAANGLWVFHG